MPGLYLVTKPLLITITNTVIKTIPLTEISRNHPLNFLLTESQQFLILYFALYKYKEEYRIVSEILLPFRLLAMTKEAILK